MSAPKLRCKATIKEPPYARKIWIELRKLEQKPYIKVGILEASGQHKGGVNVTVADVASFMEYGTETVPPRSFIASTLFKRSAELKKLVESQIRLIFEGKQTVDGALDVIGLKVTTWIKDHIIQGDFDWPPLKESTIIAKGSGQELIDTGQLLASVTYEKVMAANG